MKRSFVRVSNDSLTNKSKSRKVPCNCDKCKGLLVDPRTKKSHELKKNIRPKGIIEDIDAIQDSTNDSSQDKSVDLLSDNPDFMEVDDNNQMIIESNQPTSQEENYTFLSKKLPKGKPKGKQKDIGHDGVTYPIVVIKQNVSDYDDDDNDDDDDDNGNSINNNDLNFIEKNLNESNEPSSSSFASFDALKTDDIYDGLKMLLI